MSQILKLTNGMIPTLKVNKYFTFITNRRKLVSILIITLLSIALYSNTLSNEFVFDDYSSIITNKNITNLTNVRTIWQSNPTRFISYLSLAINYKIGKLNVTSYHITNILIHTLAGISVFFLLELLLETPALKKEQRLYSKLPFIAALIFVTHPIQTQAVTYVTQRMASMTALFYLLSLIFFLKVILLVRNASRTKNKAYYFKLLAFQFNSVCFAVLAFLTKENAFTLPLAILLIYYLFFTNSIKLIFKKFYIFLPIASIMLFVALLWQMQPGYLSMLKFKEAILSLRFADILFITHKFDYIYLITEFKVIIYYIYIFIFPLRQNVDYDFPMSNSFFEPLTLASFLLIVAIIVFALIKRSKNKLLSFGILFFFLTLSIESTIIGQLDVIYEHRLYLPSVGLVIVAGVIFCKIQNFIFTKWKNDEAKTASAKRIFTMILFGTILLLSITTISRNKIWHTQISLWTDTISKSPNKSRPYNNLGVALLAKRQYIDAAEAYQKALDRRVSYADYVNLGNALRLAGDYQNAITSYKKAIIFESATELNPQYSEAYNALGNIYLNLNKLDQAQKAYEKSIENKNNNPIAYNGLSIVYTLKGDFEKAKETKSKINNQINKAP